MIDVEWVEIIYLSLVTTLWPFGDVVVDQVEDRSEARQVVGHARTAGVQPESAARVVDPHASRTFVRLQAQGVQVAGVGRVPYQKRPNLYMNKLMNEWMN